VKKLFCTTPYKIGSAKEAGSLATMVNRFADLAISSSSGASNAPWRHCAGVGKFTGKAGLFGVKNSILQP
jgi:hypothetical protein